MNNLFGFKVKDGELPQQIFDLNFDRIPGGASIILLAPVNYTYSQLIDRLQNKIIGNRDLIFVKVGDVWKNPIILKAEDHYGIYYLDEEGLPTAYSIGEEEKTDFRVYTADLWEPE